MSAKSTTINPPQAPAPQPQFSQVNTISFAPGTKLIAITGQLAISPTDATTPPPKDFSDQVRMALKNLETCLVAAGATKRDIFKVTHHVVDFDYEGQNPAKVFIEWLEGPSAGGPVQGFRPASAMLPVTRLALPGGLYEIETWAVVNGY